MLKEFVPGEKPISPTIPTWRRWLRRRKAKLIQYGGYYKGETYPTLYEIEGKIYRSANVVAPTYSYDLAPARWEDLSPELRLLYQGGNKMIEEDKLKRAYNAGKELGVSVGVTAKELNPKADVDEVFAEWQDGFTQSAEFADVTLPDIRELAGCKDPMGVGTYTECTEEQTYIVEELLDKFYDGVHDGIEEVLKTRRFQYGKTYGSKFPAESFRESKRIGETPQVGVKIPFEKWKEVAEEKWSPLGPSEEEKEKLKDIVKREASTTAWGPLNKLIDSGEITTESELRRNIKYSLWAVPKGYEVIPKDRIPKTAQYQGVRGHDWWGSIAHYYDASTNTTYLTPLFNPNKIAFKEVKG